MTSLEDSIVDFCTSTKNITRRCAQQTWLHETLVHVDLNLNAHDAKHIK